MSSHKVLKSVVHNFGHSFTSLMNYRENDYVVGTPVGVGSHNWSGHTNC